MRDLYSKRQMENKKNIAKLKTIKREGKGGNISQLALGELVIIQRTEDARQHIYDCL